MASVGFPQVQIPGVSRYPTIDFSSLANLPNAFWQGQEVGRQRELRNVLGTEEAKAALASGDYGKLASIVSQIDPEYGRKILAQNANTADQYGTPIPIQNADGTWGIGAVPRNGNQLRIMGMPEGTSAPPQTRAVDVGNAVVNQTVRGAQPVGEPIAKTGTVPQGYRPNAEGTGYEGMPGTPESVTQPAAGKARMGGAIGVLGNAINELYKGKGISSTTNTTGQNLRAYGEQTAIGQEIGRAIGSKNQSVRDTINSTIPMVLADLKVSAGLSAQQFNSNAELAFYQQAAQGGTDLVSRLAAIDALDQAYGTGHSLEGVLPKSLFTAVRSRSGAMSSAHPLPPRETLGGTDGVGVPTPDGVSSGQPEIIDWSDL